MVLILCWKRMPFKLELFPTQKIHVENTSDYPTFDTDKPIRTTCKKLSHDTKLNSKLRMFT